jgi:hypothetical protein
MMVIFHINGGHIAKSEFGESIVGDGICPFESKDVRGYIL